MKTRKPSPPDAVLARIADYVTGRRILREQAYDTARYCLLDALACAFEALDHPECAKLLGPVVPGTIVPNGARVPGTPYTLDPIKAAFDIGTAIRWLDYNDAWFGAEGGHPSDNLGAILAVADYASRGRAGRRALTVRDVLTALIQAYEIQGVLQLENSFLSIGLDSTGLVNIASTALATALLGGSREQIINALSNAWLDGVSPRLFRMGHTTGWRKSWASGDATSRGVLHALFAVRGEMGYPTALSEPRWGMCDAVMRGQPIVIGRPFRSYIVEHILFKVPFPAQFHTQTATECALKLHPLVRDRLADVKAIRIRSHRRTLETTDKKGPLGNAAERDHCLQYVVAVVLLHGRLGPHDYEDRVASDPRIDALRSRMEVTEDSDFTRDFYDGRKRSNGSAIGVEFRDGSRTPEIRVEYPLGHPRRRKEGLPLVEEKFRASVERRFPRKQAKGIMAMCGDPRRLLALPISKFMDRLTEE